MSTLRPLIRPKSGDKANIAGLRIRATSRHRAIYSIKIFSRT